MRWRIGRIASVLSVVAVLGGCATSAHTTTTEPPNPAALQNQSEVTRTTNLAAGANVPQAPLEVFPNGFDNQGTSLRNGGVVALGGGVSAEVFLDPYPASGSSSWLDIYVGQNGQPVRDAVVDADNEMVYMSHTGSQAEGRNSGDGHYVFALDYPMLGLWHHLVSIRFDDQHYALPLMVTVYP